MDGRVRGAEGDAMARRGAIVLSTVSVVAVLVATLLLVRAANLPPAGGTPAAGAGGPGTVTVAPPATEPADPGPVVTAPPLTTPPVPPPPASVTPTPAVPPGATTSTPAPPPETGTAPPPGTTPEPPSPAAPAAPTGLPELVPPYDRVLGGYGSARTAYLTFDDGPGPHTAAVLDVLDAAGVRATFCQVGDQIADHPDVERRIVAAGHTLCNHSWSHPAHLDRAGAATIADEMTRTQDVLAGFGVTPHWFRAPGGSFGTDDPTLRQVAQLHSLVPLGWTVDSADWRKPGVQQIVDTVLTTVRPGAVILLHDAGGTDRDQTLAALPLILTGLRAAGYDLQPLPPGGA